MVSGAPASEATPSAGDRAGLHVDGRRRQLIGVRTTRVVRRALTNKVTAVGVVRVDGARLMDVNLKVEGWLREVYVTYVGQMVRAGQPIFAVYSQDLEALQTNLVAALRARDQTPVARSADGSLYADRLVMTPRQRLKQLDIADQELQELEQTGRVPPTTTFRAPMNGVVVENHAVKGMRVEPGQTLYRLADLSVVTVEADFHEIHAPLLKTGARVEVALDGTPNDRFTGTIADSYPYVSEETRTIKVRIELVNRDRRLKPGMLANVEMHTTLPEQLVAPADAIVDSGSEQIVFVSDGNGFFEPRSVKVSGRSGEDVQIVDGLREGEEIATRAAFFIDSESRMRAAGSALA
jgi:RND family efflux transporter MFP subunit